MKKYFKIGFLILLVIFLILQFFRPGKNLSEGVQPNNISTVIPLPDSIKNILTVACMDCHSNNTKYPWYANIMPLGWWLNNHVVEGKKEINFDEFATYQPKRALRKLDEVAKQVEEGEMPLSSYTRIHKNAALTESQKKSLISWANTSTTFLKEKYKDTIKVN